MLRVAALIASVAAGTNLPVPLLLLYQDRLSMSPARVTGLFGIYAAGLIPAVLVAGPAADRHGLRPVTLVGAILAVLASCGYALSADSVLWLHVVRGLQGMAAGTVFTAASIWILTLSGKRTDWGSRVAAVAMTGGFSVGSLIGGILGQWVRWPLLLPFLLHVVVGTFALFMVLVVPVTREQSKTGATKTGLFLPGRRRRALLVVAPPAVFVFGFPAIAISALPVLVGFPAAPVLFTGVLASLTLGAGAIAAPWQRRLGARTVPWAALMGCAGMLSAAVGAAGITRGSATAEVALLPAALALGAGGGLALSGGLARLPEVADPARAATVSAGFYALAYVGFGAPWLLAAIGTAIPLPVSFSFLALLCLIVWAVQRP